MRRGLHKKKPHPLRLFPRFNCCCCDSTGVTDLKDVGKTSAVEYKDSSVQADEINAEKQFGIPGIFVNKGDTLAKGCSISSGEMLVSKNDKFCALLRDDGNFVIYAGYYGDKWTSMPFPTGTGPYKLSMQTDGNLVSYDTNGQPTWASQTVGSGGVIVRMQDDGNLVIYNGEERATWASDTVQTWTDNLMQNDSLSNNHFIESESGQFRLVMQVDGNLVLYEQQFSGKPTQIWASNTQGEDCKLIMKDDGNLVIYDSTGTATWSSMTHGIGSGGFKLVIQNDGNVVIYDKEENATWNTFTKRKWKSVLSQGKSLGNNQYLTSKNKLYTAVMQSDGNFCLYVNGLYCVWASKTNGNGIGPFKLTMQEDGNLVIYDVNGKPTWASNTQAGSGGRYLLEMQNDKNLVLYKKCPTWVANTQRL